MYKDIISYKLAEGVTEFHLFKVADKVVNSWMKQQPGFISWEIFQLPDGTYNDIVTWENEAAAKKAELAMADIPHASEWYACYQMDSIQSQKLTLKKQF